LRAKRNIRIASLTKELQTIRNLQEATKTQDIVRATSQEWIYDFVIRTRKRTLKSLEPLVQKIQIHYKTALQVETIFTTDFPVKHDITLTILESYQILTLLDAGIHNAAVHAQARYVFVIASLQDELLAVIVHDNGVGYDFQEKHHREGMERIYSAAEKLKGTRKITSTLGNGTILNVEIPKASREVYSVQKGVCNASLEGAVYTN
jgi:signal transduction histidine kinase